MPGQFACQKSDCHRSYNRKEHLVRHEKSHAPLRPFSCQSCGADFYRRDLLKRHIRLSLKCKVAQNEEQQLPLEASSLDPDLAHPIPTGNNAASAARDSRRNIYVGLGPSFTAIADREELERLYFSHFHPHWPLLDEDLFMSAPQMPELVASILIAGLWMIPTREARREARRQHDTIMKDIERKLLNEQSKNPISSPSPDCLPYLQALLMPLIISTYRGTELFPDTIMANKHIFDLFHHAGVYEQQRIDESSSDPAVRQQYQRLGLLHFKAFMHYSCTFQIQFARFKPMNYFEPSILKVRVPLVETANTNPTENDRHSILVSDLLKNGGVDKLSQATVAALVAWDFSVGMIFACIVTQKENEDRKSLLMRIEPNLFLHLRGWIANPEGPSEL